MRILLNFYKIFSNLLSFFVLFFFIIRLARSKESLLSIINKFVFYKKNRPKGKLIWVNAVSIGESKSAETIINQILKKYPEVKIIFTTSTTSSYKLLNQNKKKFILLHTPLDINFVIKRFLKIWSPDLVIFFESEIWPNLISNLNKKKINFVICNARISKRSYKNWTKVSFFAKQIFQKIDLCLCQDNQSIKRFKKLGVQKVEKVGNIKFLAKKLAVDKNSLLYFKKKLEGKKVVSLFSSHEGEEEMIISCAKKLQAKFKNLFFIIIPRHIHRTNKIGMLLKKNKINYVLRSTPKDISNKKFLLVDSFGELGLFFEISSIVIVGGSFANKGGHNPIETSGFNCAIIFGPNMQNFLDISQEIIKRKAGLLALNPKQLIDKLSFFIQKPDKASQFIKNFENMCKIESTKSHQHLGKIFKLLK